MIQNGSFGMIQRNGRPVKGFSLGKPPSFGLGDQCPAALPSGDAAMRLMQGKKGAFLDVAGTMLARSALIASGLAVAGFRGTQLLKGTLAAGMAVETFVLAWAYKNRES
jgi:hypothetical protein